MGDPTLYEVLTFVASTGILVVTAIALWKQIHKQTKATSANLSLEMLKRMREEDFRDVVEKILQDQPEKCNRRDLDRLLNHFEYMALFEDDGTLDVTHIEHMYGAVLKKIKDNKFVQDIIQESVKKDPNYYYVHLRNLLKKIG
jgi:hypothetical protein